MKTIPLLLLLLLLTTNWCWGQTNYYVGGTGASDSNDGLAATVTGGHGPWATISHSDSALVLGVSGATVNVASGTYTGDLKTSHAGTATQRITWISTTPLGAHIVGNGSNLQVWQSLGDYQTIQVFDITGAATDYQGINFQSAHGRAIGNKVHDLPGTACPANGGQGIGDAGGIGGGFNDNQAIGNLIYNIGPSGCNVIHGIYWSNPADVAEDNIIGNVSGQCITSYHAATQLVISNNTMFNCGHHGILLGNNVNSLNNTTVNNNIVYSIQSGVGIDCFGGLGSNIRVANNDLFNSGGLAGAQLANCAVSGTLTSDPQFVTYQANGTGDYHLRAGSPAIGTGTATCASGGLSPCVPATDFASAAMSTPPPIGAYMFATAQTPPGAPTSLTATPH
jgi:hypothetical protein